MMDMKRKMFARATVTGVKEPFESEGITPVVLAGFMRWLSEANARKDSTGGIVISLNLSEVKHDSIRVEDELTRELRALGALDDVQMMTAEEQAIMQASLPLWNHDDEWKLFRRYMATQSNYVTAAPGEIELLQKSLRAKYAGIVHTTQDGITVTIEDSIQNTRV